MRHDEIQQNMERQFKQSMVGPDWELCDYAWCAMAWAPGLKPVHLPALTAASAISPVLADGPLASSSQ